MPFLMSLLDAASDAVVVYDPEFRFLYLNAQAERMVGSDRDQVTGAVLWEVLPERSAPFKEPLTRSMTERVPVTFEIESTVNGRWVQGHCLPIRSEDTSAGATDTTTTTTAAAPVAAGPAALAVFFRDVTQRHEADSAQADAEAARERMAFLAEASAVLASSLDYRTTLDTMAGILVPDLCDWCAVRMPSQDGAFLEQVAVAHVDAAKVELAHELSRRYPTYTDEPYGIAQVVRTGEPLFWPHVPDDLLVAAAKDEEHLRILREIGLLSAIAVPLVARQGQAPLGALVLVTSAESGRKLKEDDLAFAQELARRAAVAIENARLYRKAQQEEERFRALVDATSQMVWRTGPDGLVVDMPQWRTYTGQSEEEVRGYGWANAIHPEDRERVEKTWQDAFNARSAYECEYRVRGAADGVYRWFFVRAVPLFEEDGTTLREYIGTWASVDEQRRAEGEREEMLLAAQRRAEREALLNRVGEAIRTLTEPEEILEAAVRELGQAMNTDRCYFAEYDVPRDWARVGADWHRPDLPSLAGAYRLSELDVDAKEMFSGPGGLLHADDLTRADPEVFSSRAAAILGNLGLRAVLGVALFENGLPVAALVCAMAEEPRTWTPEEIELLRTAAALTRSAMKDARLRKREHNIAERLQEALQPSSPGRLPGLEMEAHYRPALKDASIGGDFYDVFAIEKGCYALVVADLSGKGLAAASQVATVRHMLRTLLYLRGTTLAQAVTALNEMLAEHNLLEGFSTLFVGAYDVNQRSLTYVNAGQEPGLLLRKATGQVEEMPPTGPVLGGFGEAEFSESVVTLASGDVIALFTDGLTEAGPSRKELLGVPGVVAVFQKSAAQTSEVEGIIAGMIAGVESLATPAGIRDDVCLLVGCVK